MEVLTGDGDRCSGWDSETADAPREFCVAGWRQCSGGRLVMRPPRCAADERGFGGNQATPAPAAAVGGAADEVGGVEHAGEDDEEQLVGDQRAIVVSPALPIGGVTVEGGSHPLPLQGCAWPN